MKIGNRQLVFDLLKLINPKCYKCGEIATKTIYYQLILGGEVNKCDNCPDPDKPNLRVSHIENCYHTLIVKEINRLLDNHELINIKLIERLYFCIYPKCDKCENPATRQIKYAPILHDRILKCDSCNYKKKMNNGLILASPEITDLPSAKLIRTFRELLGEK